jgi:hypothetical protein
MTKPVISNLLPSPLKWKPLSKIAAGLKSPPGRLIEPNPAVISICPIKSNVASSTRGNSKSPHLLSKGKKVPDGQ